MGIEKPQKRQKEYLESIAETISSDDKDVLIKIAKTSMQTKLVRRDSAQLAGITVKSVLAVTEKDGEVFNVDIDDVKVEKKAGGSIKDSKIIQGIVLDKEIVHGGMPRRIADAKIALINTALEISKTETDAKINISNPQQLKSFLDEEHKMLKIMVDKVIGSGGKCSAVSKRTR